MPVLDVFICDDRISKQNKRYPARKYQTAPSKGETHGIGVV